MFIKSGWKSGRDEKGCLLLTEIKAVVDVDHRPNSSFLGTSTEKSAAVNVDGTFHDQLFILSEFKFKKKFWSTLMVDVHFTAIFITPGIQTRVFQVVSLECTPLKFVSYKSAIC